jgi:calcineurin-like phosphoesterase family protein
MIENWNRVVGVKDKVYHLGDVGFKNAGYQDRILSALNGDKVLIRGNHDTLKLSTYTKHFRDVRAYWQLNKIILAHIPIHPGSLGRWKGQVHGHTHFNNLDDPRYYNISVEQTNYTPIDFEEVNEYFNSLGS